MLPSESFRMRVSLIKEFLNVTENVENVIEVKKLSPEDRTVATDDLDRTLLIQNDKTGEGFSVWHLPLANSTATRDSRVDRIRQFSYIFRSICLVSLEER